jgi:hypothetical protein
LKTKKKKESKMNEKEEEEEELKEFWTMETRYYGRLDQHALITVVDRELGLRNDMAPLSSHPRVVVAVVERRRVDGPPR